MLNDRKFSLLYPRGKEVRYKRIEDSTFHDLGLDVICKEVTSEPKEQNVITEIISNLTSNPDVTNYRQEIFEDLKDIPSGCQSQARRTFRQDRIQQNLRDVPEIQRRGRGSLVLHAPLKSVPRLHHLR